MLRMDFGAFCRGHTPLEAEGGTAFRYGEGAALVAVLLCRGRCSAEDATAQLPATTGNFILAAGPVMFTPLEPCQFVGICLDGQVPRAMVQQLQSAAVLDAADTPDAVDLLYRLVGSSPTDDAQHSALAYTLLCRLSGAKRARGELPALVAQAAAQMHRHYSEVYGVEELAESLGVSKSHLVRSFSATMGISPGRYLTAVRIDAAKRLLLHRSYPLEVVASLCGFSGANYLCKVFKKEMGQSPAVWRQQNGQSLGPAQAEELAEWEGRLFL